MYGIDDSIVASLGIGLPQIIMIGTFFFGLIICAKDFRIGTMIWVILYFVEFVLFYEVFPGTLGWLQSFIAWFVSVVFLLLLLFLGFWKYEDTRKIIT